MIQARKGRVLAAGAPKPGVVVSDGCSVVVTDASGAFAFPALPTLQPEPLWVCIPSGFRVVGPWYLPADATDPTFVLKTDPSHTEAFSFVFYTDIHLIRDSAEQPFSAVLAEIRELSPLPAFCVCGGDIELQSGMGQTYRRLLDGFPLPVRHGAGNHDLLVGRSDPWEAFRSLFGPKRYSWNNGRFHFVVLTALIPNLEQEGWRNVEGELTIEELAWLEADLRLAGGRPVVVFLHIPPVSTFSQRQGKRLGEEPAWEVRNADRLLELCARYPVRLVLSGHFHENERTFRGSTEFLTTGAVCGHWWERGGRPPVNLDGSPKGYRIAYVDGDTITSVYKAMGESQRRQLAIVTPRPGEVVTGRLALGVNVFDGDGGIRVERRIDQGEWVQMRYTPQPAGPNTFSSAHFWTDWAPPELTPGPHLLTVRATFPNRERFTERVAFTVCGSGLANPSPRDAR
jgi:Icc protein